MLLRSSSTPIFKTYCCQLLYEVDHHALSSPNRNVRIPLQRTSSEGQLKQFISSLGCNVSDKMMSTSSVRSLVIIKEKEEINICMETASSLLSDKVEVGGGGGGRGGGDNNGGSWGSGNDRDGSCEQMDVYYQGMIKTYPGDGLLLANYAKFLKEVRGDNVKAEEICERAILTNKSDGNVLSMYGDLIWNNHKDSVRAETYFDQAVQYSPEDCYVLASYAKFLWDVPDEENGEENETNFQFEKFSPPSRNGYPPLAAPS